jgi:hypothetical protein
MSLSLFANISFLVMISHNRRHQEPDFHRNDAIAEEASCCGTWKWAWNAVVRIVRYCSPAEDMTEPEMMWNAVHLIFIYCIVDSYIT